MPLLLRVPAFNEAPPDVASSIVIILKPHAESHRRNFAPSALLEFR